MTVELSNRPEYRATMKRLEDVKRVTSQGVDYWKAREIHPVLGYPIWANFEPVIERTKIAFRSNGMDPTHHFVPTGKMVEIGSGSQRRVGDFYMSRAACYLAAMNGDPTKPERSLPRRHISLFRRDE